VRRLDLKMFTPAQAPAALVSWTGNTLLNRSLRTLCLALGFSLSDQWLAPTSAIEDVGDSRDRAGQSHSTAVADATAGVAVGIPCRAEIDIFSFLGLE
jgi:hypothetical protein